MIMIRKMGRSLGFKELVIGGGEMYGAVTYVVKQRRKRYTCHLLCRDKICYVIITIFHPHPLFHLPIPITTAIFQRYVHTWQRYTSLLTLSRIH